MSRFLLLFVFSFYLIVEYGYSTDAECPDPSESPSSPKRQRLKAETEDADSSLVGADEKPKVDDVDVPAAPFPTLPADASASGEKFVQWKLVDFSLEDHQRNIVKLGKLLEEHGSSGANPNIAVAHLTVRRNSEIFKVTLPYFFLSGWEIETFNAQAQMKGERGIEGLLRRESAPCHALYEVRMLEDYFENKGKYKEHLRSLGFSDGDLSDEGFEIKYFHSEQSLLQFLKSHKRKFGLIPGDDVTVHVLSYSEVCDRCTEAFIKSRDDDIVFTLDSVKYEGQRRPITVRDEAAASSFTGFPDILNELRKLCPEIEELKKELPQIDHLGHWQQRLVGRKGVEFDTEERLCYHLVHGFQMMTKGQKKGQEVIRKVMSAEKPRGLVCRLDGQLPLPRWEKIKELAGQTLEMLKSK